MSNATTSTRRRQSHPSQKKMETRVKHWFQFGVTFVMGIAIPLISLALSTIAGQLARASIWWLAVAAAACGCTILFVSLSHLQEAIRQITKSAVIASWLMAIAFDCGIVLCECCHVFAHEVPMQLTVNCLMVGLIALSMALNVYAFFCCKHK